MKLSYDLDPKTVDESKAILQERHDYSKKLSIAFEELISIAQAETPKSGGSTESFMRAGLFLSAKSSFCSDIAEAIELLNSPSSTADEDFIPSPDGVNDILPSVPYRRTISVSLSLVRYAQ